MHAAQQKLRLGFGASNATFEGEAVILSFSNILWLAIAVLEICLVTARMLMHPGPVRLAFALLIPLLIILGAIANAIWHATGVRVHRFPIRIEDLLT